MHLPCSFHLEGHAIHVLELQLFVYVFVGTAIVDKDFHLFKVGSGGKWGVAIFWPPDVMPDGTFSWTMEVHSRDDAHWALQVRVVQDEHFSRLKGDRLIGPY